jgi:hypothetical protein
MSTKEFTKKSLAYQYIGGSSVQWKRTEKSTSKNNDLNIEG